MSTQRPRVTLQNDSERWYSALQRRMGKKKSRDNLWPEAKHLCRLNQDEIAMAKRLGFTPEKLIRSRPDPKQKWKLPVKYWIRDLHLQRFGHILGEKPSVPVAEPVEWVYDEEAARRFEEEMYWDDYHDRNSEPSPPKPRTPAKSIKDKIVFIDNDRDRDVPF